MSEKHNYSEAPKPIVRLFDVPIGGTFKREVIVLPSGSSLFDLYHVIKNIPGSEHMLTESVTLVYEENH